MQLRGLCWIGTLRVQGREEDYGRPGGGQLWKRHRGRTWREVKRLAVDRGHWKSFMEALSSYTGDNRK
jgi:hypothetical protein